MCCPMELGSVLCKRFIVVIFPLCLTWQVKQLVDDLLAEVVKREEVLAELRSTVEQEYQSLAAAHRVEQEHEQSPEL